MKYALLFCLLMVIGCPLARGQQDTSNTEKFYLNLQKLSKKSRLSYLLYESVFNVPNLEILDSLVQETRPKEGLVIRNIIIYTNDPFGAELNDSSRIPRSILQKTGNALHTKTKQKAIENQLMFQVGEKTDLLKIKESERIIRNCGYIREVRIRVLPSCSDSADVIVETIDQWSFTTSGTISSSKARWKFTGFDLFGMGHRFGNSLEWKRDGIELTRPELEGFYRIPDIAGSFTSLEINYLSRIENKSLGVIIDRPFYSSLSNWAGGIEISRNSSSDSIRITKETKTGFSREWTDYGAWIGYAIPIKKGQTMEERSTRFILSASCSVIENRRLSVSNESAAAILSTRRTLLLSTGFSNRTYSVKRFIFQSGNEEDVPSGRKVQITAGVENTSIANRPYASANVAVGGFIGSGFYVSTSLSWSTFLNKKNPEDSKIQFKALAFTPLIGVDKWKVRIFGTIDYTQYRNQTYFRPIGLNEDGLLPGYDRTDPEGTERLAGNLTLALFNPVEIIGFKFTPLLYFSSGFVGTGEKAIWRSSIQSSIGAGVVVTNEFLAQSDFKLVLAIFPGQSDFYKTGDVSAWEYEFSDFDFKKPEVVY